MADIKLLAKAGLAVLVVVSLAVLIERLTSARLSTDINIDDSSSDLITNYTAYPTVNIVESVYNESLAKCFREHSNSYYYPLDQVQNASLSCLAPETCLYDFLINTTRLFKSFEIKIHLLEPSILFCLLSPAQKFILLKRGFRSSKVHAMRNIINCGLDKSETDKLDQESTRKKLESLGYRILRFQKKLKTDERNEHASERDEVTHYFFIQKDQILHLVVFQPRDSYLFSSALEPSVISLSGLQFVSDKAFEKFNTSTIYMDTLSSAPILLPSDIRFFFLDVMSSDFLKCNRSELDNNVHTNGEVVVAVEELKSILYSQMISFWLWSKSLQGWYESCNIQHYSKGLQFSVAAKSVEGYNFSALFSDSKCQYIENRSAVTNHITNVKLNCYGIPIHLIFMNEDKITYWYEVINNGKIYRLRFPKFMMCSTDIYKQKIGVPCETREILDSQYGQFLKNTTLNLDSKHLKNVLLIR